MTADPPAFDPVEHFRGHVLSKVGLAFTDDEGGGPAVTLEPHPMVLDDDGHVSLGVLGVLFDLASSVASDNRGRPFVHADIGVQRLRPPSGTMLVTGAPARAGRRTAIVELEMHDRTGALVATSTQEIVWRGPEGEGVVSEAMEQMRSMFRTMFDGTCRLTRPIEQELGVTADGAGAWSMALGPDRTNGMAALHGGSAVVLVDAAVAGVMAERWHRPARTLSTTLRYLRPALVGPFVARPEVRVDEGGAAVLRVPVIDTGAGDELVIVAEAHAVPA